MGEMIAYRCAGCGFESDSVLVGRGFSGVQHAALGCATCRTVHGVTVATWRDASVGAEPPADTWANGDPCPECVGAVEVLDSASDSNRSRCPVCRERRMSVVPLGLWD